METRKDEESTRGKASGSNRRHPPRATPSQRRRNANDHGSKHEPVLTPTIRKHTEAYRTPIIVDPRLDKQHPVPNSRSTLSSFTSSQRAERATQGPGQAPKGPTECSSERRTSNLLGEGAPVLLARVDDALPVVLPLLRDPAV